MPVKVTRNDTTIEYAYDAGGQRTKKTIKKNEATLEQCIYIRNGSNVLAEYRNGQLDHYNIYGNGLIGKLKPFLNKAVLNTGSTNWTVTAKDTAELRSTSRLDAGGSLLAVGQAQGYGDKRYYYLSDHLGSIRVVLNESGQVDSWSDYYPFGKESRSGYSQNTPKEKYTGKERDIEIGLDYFGARYYNADIGRWTTKDPLAEKYPSLSPYHYSNNNPILFVDFDGRDFGIKVDHDAKTIVISANYYISQSQGDAQQMTAGAVAQWNSYTGSYTTRDGIEYSVSIELKACVASDLGAKGDANLDAIGNSVTGLSSDEFDTKNPPKDGKSIVGGVTKDNRMIDLSIGRANENATAHEIGHTLLLADKYGFGNNSAMQQSGKNPVSQGDVKKLIEYGIDGVRKSNRHIQVSQSGNYTGKKGFASRGLKEIFFGRKINVDKKDNE